MRAVLLIDNGTLRPRDGAAVIRTAARLRALGAAQLVSACFLHDARPTFAEALEGCVARGAGEVVLVPYALTDAPFVRDDLPRLRDAAALSYPELSVYLAPPLRDHPAVAAVLLQRAAEADYVAAHPILAEHIGPREDVGEPWRPVYLRYPAEAVADEVRGDREPWQPMYISHRAGLLLVAAGLRRGLQSGSAYAVAERIRRQQRYAEVQVCLLDRGMPALAASLDGLAAEGVHHAIAVPYTLQPGDPLIARLTAAAESVRGRRPEFHLLQAEHLTYDRRLAGALADRVSEAVQSSLRSAS